MSVWRIPVNSGEEEKILDGVNPGTLWTVGQRGIYFFDMRNNLFLHEFATGKTKKIVTVERQVTDGLAVSPDGKTILYPQVDEAGSDLVLVDNFR